MTPARGPKQDATGVAVDVAGYPVKDPTANVLDLVQAAIQRQDDLRNSEVRHAQEMRRSARAYEDRLDAKDQQIRLAESARIDAIRAVDVGAVNRAAEVSAQQAQTLATQVATSAEALRGQVEAARQQTATALAAALEPIQKDIQDLRRAQYEAQGKQGQVVEQRLDTGLNYTAISVLIGFLVLAISLYAALHH